MHISNLPLQEMIEGVVKQATDKMAADQGVEKTAQATCSKCGHDNCPAGCPADCACKTHEKTAEDWTNPSYVEKLASACDFIAQNIDNVEAPNRGVLGAAIDKMANEKQKGLPSDQAEPVPPPQPAGALETTTGKSGTQQYKKDQPKTEDAAASQASTSEGTAGLPAGSTQMKNNMESAPGGNSGSVPTKSYPTDGPFHAGSKTASSVIDLLKQAGSQVLNKESEGDGEIHDQVKDEGKTKEAMCKMCGEVKCACIPKSAADVARDKILRKLAGEDVMKANISSPKDGGPLVGDGVMDAHQAEQVPSNPTDGSGYGNPQRSHVQSNQGAIDYTKGDAKKPQGKQMKEVLDEPAFSPSTDSKLREQLRNAGQAGVKIAGANASAIIKQAAAEGRINQETVNQFAKTGAFTGGVGGGGGYSAGAPTPPNPAGGKTAQADGCTCNGTGTCKVCKLRAATEKQSMLPGGGMPGGGMMGGGGMGY